MSPSVRRPAAVAVVGLIVVALLALLVASGASAAWDQAVIGLVRSPELVGPLAPLRAVTELGSTAAVTIVAVLTVFVGIVIGPWLHGLVGAAVIGFASVGNAVAKRVVARERPDLLDPLVIEPGYSFPSGHSILGMVAWGVMAVLVSRSRLPRPVRMVVIGLLATIVVLIGVSRVYLGVHYPTDVLAGWVAGGVVVYAYAALTRQVPKAPDVAAAGEDPAAPRSDPPATG